MLLTVFTVIHAKAVHPLCPGLMVRKGTQLHLDTTQYLKHARLAAKLRRSKAWSEDSDHVVVERAPEPEPEAPKEDATIYDHQLQVVERIRARAAQSQELPSLRPPR